MPSIACIAALRRVSTPWSTCKRRDGDEMAFLELEALTKTFGAHAAVDGLSLDGREGRVRLPAGSVGLRQDHDPADDRGLRRADLGGDPARGPRPPGGQAGQARPRHRVPELRAVPAHDGGRERGVRTRDAGRGRGRAHQAGRRDAGAGRAGGLRRALSAPAFGRPAAARGAGPRAGHPAADPAARRAALATSTPSCARRCRSSCARSSARSARRRSW